MIIRVGNGYMYEDKLRCYFIFVFLIIGVFIKTVCLMIVNCCLIQLGILILFL
jgi:hypothetical protein